MTTTNLVQSRINTLQLKKGHLKTLLQQSHKAIETANDKTSMLPGEIEVYKSALDIATKENQRVNKELSQMKETNKGLISQLNQLKGTNNGLITQLNELKDTNYDLTTKNKDLADQIESTVSSKLGNKGKTEEKNEEVIEDHEYLEMSQSDCDEEYDIEEYEEIEDNEEEALCIMVHNHGEPASEGRRVVVHDQQAKKPRMS